MRTEAAIDNDFVMHLAEIDNWDQTELEDKIKVIMSELDVIAVMHELVYKYELEGGADSRYKEVALNFFRHGVLNINNIEDFLETEEKKQYYEIVLKELYYDFVGDFPCEISDVLKDWKAKASLGEVHTVTMCFIIGCDIFLSDDDDSKTLERIIRRKRAFEMKVFNREDVCNRLKERGTSLKKDVRKVIKHKPKR